MCFKKEKPSSFAVCRRNLGVAYEDQCLKPLPRNSYDQSLDWVITEQKIKEF